MDPRSVFYKHPYPTYVTVAFLFVVLITAVYFFSLSPGVRETDPRLTVLTVILVILFVTTAATWITAILLRSEQT